MMLARKDGEDESMSEGLIKSSETMAPMMRTETSVLPLLAL